MICPPQTPRARDPHLRETTCFVLSHVISVVRSTVHRGRPWVVAVSSHRVGAVSGWRHTDISESRAVPYAPLPQHHTTHANTTRAHAVLRPPNNPPYFHYIAPPRPIDPRVHPVLPARVTPPFFTLSGISPAPCFVQSSPPISTIAAADTFFELGLLSSPSHPPAQSVTPQQPSPCIGRGFIRRLRPALLVRCMQGQSVVS